MECQFTDMTVSKSTRVVVWHDAPPTRDSINTAVDSLGYERITHHQDANGFVERVIADESVRLIICGSTVHNDCAIDRLLQISKHRAVPAVIITNEHELKIVEKALEDHVMGYLLEPLRPVEIRPTIMLVMRRFDEFMGLRDQVQELKDTINERRTIERAKGIIMRRSNVDENEAYQRLRRIAMDTRSKIVDAADRVLDGEEATVHNMDKR